MTFFFVNVSFCDFDSDEMQFQDIASIMLGKQNGPATLI